LFAVAPALVGIVDVDQVGEADAPESSILFAVAFDASILASVTAFALIVVV
jgi:hypothetical protein